LPEVPSLFFCAATSIAASRRIHGARHIIFVIILSRNYIEPPRGVNALHTFIEPQ